MTLILTLTLTAMVTLITTLSAVLVLLLVMMVVMVVAVVVIAGQELVAELHHHHINRSQRMELWIFGCSSRTPSSVFLEVKEVVVVVAVVLMDTILAENKLVHEGALSFMEVAERTEEGELEHQDGDGG